MQAAATSNKMELSRVTKELEATKATLAQRKMAAETLNSQVSIVLLLTVLFVFTLSNNNLRLIPVKINDSILHTVYYIQQSATQGSNDMTHRLSCRTAATTRFSPESKGCQKQMVLSFLPTI